MVLLWISASEIPVSPSHSPIPDWKFFDPSLTLRLYRRTLCVQGAAPGNWHRRYPQPMLLYDRLYCITELVTPPSKSNPPPSSPGLLLSWEMHCWIVRRSQFQPQIPTGPLP